MDIKKLQTIVFDALEDVKGQNILTFDTTHLTSQFDRVAIASGTSNRQTKALAASVRDKVKENGGMIVGIEGEDTGEWVLVDLGDMIVHIMQPAIRDYYRLEEIWGDKEVKLGAANRTSKRTATQSAEGKVTAPKKPGRHLAATQALDDDEKPKKAPARKTAAKKTATGSAAPAGKKVKVAAKKSASKTAVKSAAKKAPAKKAPAKRTTAKSKAD
jgi:ribosome-associated protein